LPDADEGKPGRSRFKTYRSGSFISTLPRSTPRRVASKFAFAQLHERATRRIAADFLHALIAAVPYRIHTVLTDNSLPRTRSGGTQFVDRTPSNEAHEAAAAAYWAAKGESRVWLLHAFDHACEQHSIEHRATKPAHPLSVLLNRSSSRIGSSGCCRMMDERAGGTDEPDAQ
jgi:hypothetical protein